MLATLGKVFSLAHIDEARFEKERSTIAIAKPNDLTARVQVQDLEKTTQGRGDEPNRILLVTIHHMIYPITVEVLHQIFSPQGFKHAIAVRNSLQGSDIYEDCCQLAIEFSNLKEIQGNQDEYICYYYWENCFSILNANEADNTKPPLFADTFCNNGGDDLETFGPMTLAEEVVKSGHSSTLLWNTEVHELSNYGK
ncbi:polypyrimidine tract-binding protein homolog 3 [Tanacetum coccineum]|uniref:Polypyrimidine tract-binding protein homolog 3 n=1 Tax=Tanacetum coccineum TaxID=301880 RepID=A0ABQ4WE98_9ASTR